MPFIFYTQASCLSLTSIILTIDMEPRYIKRLHFIPTVGPLRIFIISTRICEQNALIAGIRAKPELSRPEAILRGSTIPIIKKQK
jgi:hypothetical protein